MKDQTDVFSSHYTEARHRAICALRVCVSKRSFESQDDPLYRKEVELLRPGTLVPSSYTVSRDVSTLYKGFAPVVEKYFEVICYLLYITAHLADYCVDAEAESTRSRHHRWMDITYWSCLSWLWYTVGGKWPNIFHDS